MRRGGVWSSRGHPSGIFNGGARWLSGHEWVVSHQFESRLLTLSGHTFLKRDRADFQFTALSEFHTLNASNLGDYALLDYLVKPGLRRLRQAGALFLMLVVGVIDRVEAAIELPVKTSVLATKISPAPNAAFIVVFDRSHNIQMKLPNYGGTNSACIFWQGFMALENNLNGFSGAKDSPPT